MANPFYDRRMELVEDIRARFQEVSGVTVESHDLHGFLNAIAKDKRLGALVSEHQDTSKAEAACVAKGDGFPEALEPRKTKRAATPQEQAEAAAMEDYGGSSRPLGASSEIIGAPQIIPQATEPVTESPKPSEPAKPKK